MLKTAKFECEGKEYKIRYIEVPEGFIFKTFDENDAAVGPEYTLSRQMAEDMIHSRRDGDGAANDSEQTDIVERCGIEVAIFAIKARKVG